MIYLLLQASLCYLEDLRGNAFGKQFIEVDTLDAESRVQNQLMLPIFHGKSYLADLTPFLISDMPSPMFLLRAEGPRSL